MEKPHRHHQCRLPCFHQKSHVQESADLIFHGGNIITMNDAQPRVEALAVKGNYIMALGDLKDLRHLIGKGTQQVNLKGRTLLPGFIEAHQHAIMAACDRSFYVDVGGNVCRTVDEVMAKITAAIVDAKQNATPGEIPWVGISGWDVELLPQLPKLSATYMDQNFTADLPLVIIGQSGHTAWANHKALEIAGITNATPSPPGGTIVKDESGNLTGQLLEGSAILMVLGKIPPPPLEKLKEGYKAQWYDYARCGYTTVTDLSMLPGQLVPELIPSTPAVRLACYAYECVTLPDIPKSDMVWLAGVKFCADGSPHCGTACVSQPYLDTDLSRRLCFPTSDHPCGILNWTKEELYAMAKPWSDQGLQIAIHAHGDVAIDTALDVYERLNAPTRRHRIEHMGFAKKEQLARCSKLGVAPSMFVCQLYYYAETFYKDLFGPERTNNWCCIDAAVKSGCVLSLHTDSPTFPSPPSALITMKTAITRTVRNKPDKKFAYGPEHCITVHEALKAYTVGPAWQLFRERELGSLQVNKLADLVILSANPYDVDPLKFDDPNVIRVVETYTGGKCNNLEN